MAEQRKNHKYYVARALDRAIAEWGKDIREPVGVVTSHPIVDRYIRGAEGSQAHIREYENRSKVKARQFQWCGSFASWCWGLSLDPDIRKYIMRSCSRIRGMYTKATPVELRGWGPKRRVAAHVIQPGDIMLIGKDEGTHITLVFAVEGDTIHTIEGNSTGIGPKGDRFEGVVRHERSRSEAKWVIRLQMEDLS